MAEEKNEVTEVTPKSLRDLLEVYQEIWNPALIDLTNVKYTRLAGMDTIYPGSLIIRENVNNKDIKLVCFVYAVKDGKVKYYDWVSPMEMTESEFKHYTFWHFDQDSVRRVGI